MKACAQDIDFIMLVKMTNFHTTVTLKDEEYVP